MADLNIYLFEVQLKTFPEKWSMRKGTSLQNINILENKEHISKHIFFKLFKNKEFKLPAKPNLLVLCLLATQDHNLRGKKKNQNTRNPFLLA